MVIVRFVPKSRLSTAVWIINGHRSMSASRRFISDNGQ